MGHTRAPSARCGIGPPQFRKCLSGRIVAALHFEIVFVERRELADPALETDDGVRTVKWFDSQKGYGIIQPHGGGKDVFVHISAVEKAGLPGLNEGQCVEYEEVTNREKTSAENLKVQRWAGP
jgi:cold shock protein